MFKALLCFGMAVACFLLPEYVAEHGVVGTEVPCSDVCVQPEDVWCSGATPDCASHYEVWNSLPPAGAFGKGLAQGVRAQVRAVLNSLPPTEN